ncbi:CBS domain-containing protein [Candidatus Bathyarchaeota archaeon]|nr:CBS domain-containing protein [Candidatus Bathyarchaeota archaeon]NIU81607.1 CBS domain-containing protein [Candidatus Bathyarchaeota archaeon]NIV68252.1 CBS domain-containing protein [Candidatus Bathyarchaeota archaeon]NIW16000.1 CBS domain-containing protein [Candidatus Bathyarchaeota archaeon]NIW34777.1 CBS domain-containing protein [Candidatus Bathyarchaeota archaeon]
MAEIGIRTRMLVKDVMSSPVFTIDEEANANEAAQMMDKHELGCIVVTSSEGKPLGIITERDLVKRVLAKNAKASKLSAREVMTAPLITVDPDETLSEAARRMSELHIRRLGVMYKGNLVGLISSKDILAITPELIEIIEEKARLEARPMAEETVEYPPMTGYCDRCGAWSDALEEQEGSFLCEECRTQLER